MSLQAIENGRVLTEIHRWEPSKASGTTILRTNRSKPSSGNEVQFSIEDISKSKNDQNRKRTEPDPAAFLLDGREDRISDPDDRQSVDWRFQDGFLNDSIKLSAKFLDEASSLKVDENAEEETKESKVKKALEQCFLDISEGLESKDSFGFERALYLLGDIIEGAKGKILTTEEQHVEAQQQDIKEKETEVLMRVLSGLEQTIQEIGKGKEEDDAYKAMREDLQEILGGIINIVSSKNNEDK